MIIKRISNLGWRGCVTVIGLGQIVINRIEHVGILCIGQSFFVLNGDICRRQWRLWSLAINLHRKLCVHHYNNLLWTQFRIIKVCYFKFKEFILLCIRIETKVWNNLSIENSASNNNISSSPFQHRFWHYLLKLSEIIKLIFERIVFELLQS